VESLGDKLRTAREEKGYSHEQVGRDTNIARRYLEALETEDFAKFPGEPYLLGFLRNYGEYLGLDANELLSLYRAIKIQEQPVPVEQLLRNTKSFPRVLVVALTVIITLALAGGGYYLFALRPKPGGVSAVPARTPAEYSLEEGQLEQRLYLGDTVIVPLRDDTYKVELREMGDPLSLYFPHGNEELSTRLGGDVEIDLDGDGFTDLTVTLADYDSASPAAGAKLRFTLNAMQLPEAPVTEEQAAEARSNAPIFAPSTVQYPFTVEVQFQGYCMFRWEVPRRDDQGREYWERNERYHARNDPPITFQAQRVRLGVSNANAIQLQLTGAGRTVPLELGGVGEVVVTELRWFRENDGRFRLSHFRLD
jgi:cytoskeletal protein RodZ